MNYSVSHYGKTDVGLVRHNNEDFWKVLPDEKLFVLCDGMGGHKGGEVASREATETLCAYFKEHFPLLENTSLDRLIQLIYDSICEANGVVYRMAKQFEELKGMGTTICCLYAHAEGLICGHVGDSRIYRYRDNDLQLLTRDDSLLRDLLDLGQISEQQSDQFMYKNILTKALGTVPILEPTVTIETAFVGDRILICSDGLTDMLSDQEIKEKMGVSVENEIAPNLIKAAIAKGGNDNITVIVITIHQP